MTFEDKTENQKGNDLNIENTENETEVQSNNLQAETKTENEINTQNQEITTESKKEEETPSENIKIQTKEENPQDEIPQEVPLKEEVIEIYTDGACSGNPGPGGYAAVILKNNECIEIKGGASKTTNNKMELMGAISALKEIINTENQRIKLYTDSIYVQKGITEWIENWKKKNYKDVKNVELWKELNDLNSQLNIEWHWIKAHAGNKYNEMADSLARGEVDKNR